MTLFQRNSSQQTYSKDTTLTTISNVTLANLSMDPSLSMPSGHKLPPSSCLLYLRCPIYQPCRVQSSLQIRQFCIHGFNQAHVKNIQKKKFQEVQKKNTLNLPHAGNDFQRFALYCSLL